VLVSPNETWKSGSIPLRFQIGDIRLGEVRLPLLRRSAALDELPLDLGDIPESPPDLGGAVGYVIWSRPLVRRLPVMTPRWDAIRYVPRQYRRFSIELSGGFDQYMAAFSGRTRSGLKRKLRKFADTSRSGVDFRQYRTPAQIECFFALARKVSSKTYQERRLKLGFPDHQEFFATAIALSKQDCIRGYILFLSSEPISYLYCTVRRDVVSYDHHGFDPAFAKLSPGTVLQLLALQTLFEEQRFSTFDFTAGEGCHKERFSTQSRLCGDVFVVKRRVLPILMILLHYSVDRTSQSAGTILDRVNLKSALRRRLRAA
jgi:hypothetical protein